MHVRDAGIHQRLLPCRSTPAVPLCPFALWPALPASLTTTGTPPRPAASSGRRACPRPTRIGQQRAASHVHRPPVGQGGAQLYPGSIATSTPQAFLVASWPTSRTGVGVAAHLDGVHCSPAHIRQVRAGGSLTGRYALVPRVHLLALLAGPGPSGSADPSRRCQGCSRPSVRLHGQAALSFTGLLRQPSSGPFHPARCDGAS
jgi:hypothetical protein